MTQAYKLAFEQYSQIIQECARAPESRIARVADLIEAFLSWSEKHQAHDTWRGHRFYGQKFAEAYGQMKPLNIEPYHVTRFVDAKDWNDALLRASGVVLAIG